MSGLDPLAALAAQVLANANIAMEQATLDLGAALAELQSQISVGQVIVATVLPPQNGVDYISLLGQNVPAQLPPGINPGEAIAVQVTGFTNTAILVTNLGPVDPSNPPTAADLPPVQTPAAALPAQNAVLTTTNPAPPALANPTGTPIAPAPSAPPSNAGAPVPPVAPPREFFVAASVRGSTSPLPEVIVTDAPEAIAPHDLEARIALNRTGSAPPPPIQPIVTRAVARDATPVTPRAQEFPTAPLTGRTSVPPIITPSRAVGVERSGAPQAPAPGVAPGSRPTSPEATLLGRLRIPISAATLLAARGISTAAQSVTSSYQKLEALLAGLPANEPTNEQTTSLRTALAFVAKFDLRSTRALPEQIAAFVSNVVEGAESKIAQIVRAWSTGVALAATDEEAAQAPGARPNAVQTPGSQAQVVGTPASIAALPLPVPAAVEARSAERMVALDHDVKTAILAMIENPPPGTTPQLNAALREALTATNALQFNVLASKNDTNTITIPLPAYFYEGGKPAQIRISRDVPGGKNAMDADNFHVSFILDTKSLGTVGIDVQTVSRSVSIDVKTQGAMPAERFRSTLGELRARLEQMRYHVATIGAGVVSAPTPMPNAGEPVADSSPTSNVDLRA